MPNDNDKKIKELEQKLEKIEQENGELNEKLGELENNWKRALADYRNFQKRVDEEKQSFVDFANSSLILRVLNVLDNLEMLNQHIEDIGLKMIVKELKQVLLDEGLREIETLNKEFNAEQMDAVDTIEGEKNKVMVVTQKGYFLKDKVIRPARVKVGNGKESEVTKK